MSEQRIALPARTARRLSDLLVQALAAQSVAQAAVAETQRIGAAYQQALEALAEQHDVPVAALRFDREAGVLVVASAPEVTA